MPTNNKTSSTKASTIESNNSLCCFFVKKLILEFRFFLDLKFFVFIFSKIKMNFKQPRFASETTHENQNIKGQKMECFYIGINNYLSAH